MQTGTLTSGPGFIGGNISLGANKGSANGVPGILVFLRNSQSRIVSRTMTDAQGNFSFANLALGAYSIYPEVMNFATTPITPIVLNSTSDTVMSADFSYDEARRSIVPRNSLEIPVCYAAPGVYVTPVPAHDNVNINWISSASGELQFFVTNYTGQTVARTERLQGVSGSVSLNVRNLAPGIYFVHGTGSMSGSVTRIVIQ